MLIKLRKILHLAEGNLFYHCCMQAATRPQQLSSQWGRNQTCPLAAGLEMCWADKGSQLLSAWQCVRCMCRGKNKMSWAVSLLIAYSGRGMREGGNLIKPSKVSPVCAELPNTSSKTSLWCNNTVGMYRMGQREVTQNTLLSFFSSASTLLFSGDHSENKQNESQVQHLVQSP